MSLNSVRKKKWGKNKQTRFAELSENVLDIIVDRMEARTRKKGNKTGC